ncbi:PREDICTED: uncharacterized protein LOC104768452 isoform X1 [Camelina sativa]|uniref:Uncharacterized protein LOC104768452 isoform X1 n=1 Tax=Camelina sativa TaxID=90675 RepID=A0ABM0XTA5_CAMSA|nr:PREDICTED: uncharacterized protein LOC104768452 isoform X1 [Camelina sativa]
MGNLGCDSHGELNDAEFSKPLPSIGLYVAAASLICGLAMAADLLHGFRHRKFWFPCKFFSLNATSLTFIGVGIKLSVDLNTSMPSRHDQLSKLSSSVFVCTVMGNSMPSLGIMENQDLLMNLMALGILVITDVVNICIQLGTGAIYAFKEEHFLVLLLMLLMLLILSFSATAVPTTKRILETKYKKKYVALQCPLATERTTVAKRIQQDLSKFWMMAHTSSPQFVMARSVTCTASGFFCLLSAVTLGEAMVRSYLLRPRSLGFCHGDSDYKWSTFLVLVCQTTAVVIGTVAPAIRWFTAVKFHCPLRGKKSYRDEFRVESYWTQWFSEKKQRPLSLSILKDRSCRKIAHDAKRWILDVCIGIQYVIVFASKIIRYISVYCISRILICCYFAVRRLRTRGTVSHVESESSNPSSRQELARFVLHLEGEDELVDLMVRSNCEATDHWITNGRKKQPIDLIELLEATTPVSKGFEGIKEFDSNEVASLAASGEPPNCWALPLVTLATIAVALPNVKPCSVEKLLNAVNEALDSVSKFEHILDTGGELSNLRKAAEVVWLGVDLYHKWFDVDLRKLSKQQKSPEETLRELVEVAKKEFSESWQMNLMACMKHKPSHWPIKTLAANSMYRICQTILHNYESRDYGTGEALLKKLETTISDIVSGCFCNVGQVISIKCLVTAVEVREESVRGAALHLGKTEKIIEIVERRCLPELKCDRMKNIDEWRAFYKINSSDSNNKTVSPDSNELCIFVE